MGLSNKEELIHADFCIYKHQIDYADKLLSIYAIINMGDSDQLRKFEKDILNYYFRYGYSVETKKRIKKELKKKSDTITQATFYLSKKGYLIQSKTNFSQKTLNKDLQRLRENFILGNKKIMAIGFKVK